MELTGPEINEAYREKTLSPAALFLSYYCATFKAKHSERYVRFLLVFQLANIPCLNNIRSTMSSFKLQKQESSKQTFLLNRNFNEFGSMYMVKAM